jgi:surface antigen
VAYGGTGFFALTDAPVASMTDDDFAIAVPVVGDALERGRDGTTYRWANPASGASGSITPTAAFVRNDFACRSADFAIADGGRTRTSAWTLCNAADGWKVLDH